MRSILLVGPASLLKLKRNVIAHQPFRLVIEMKGQQVRRITRKALQLMVLRARIIHPSRVKGENCGSGLSCCLPQRKSDEVGSHEQDDELLSM